MRQCSSVVTPDSIFIFGGFCVSGVLSSPISFISDELSSPFHLKCRMDSCHPFSRNAIDQIFPLRSCSLVHLLTNYLTSHYHFNNCSLAHLLTNTNQLSFEQSLTCSLTHQHLNLLKSFDQSFTCSLAQQHLYQLSSYSYD